MNAVLLIHVLLALVVSPLLLGIIARTKAKCAGRKGRPLLQLYFDIAKLLRKNFVYSQTTTFVFRASPILAVACTLMAIALLPCGVGEGLYVFQGDLILFVYLLGLSRFFTISAALDTGSSFEGMGASREALLSTLAEPTFLMSLFALVRISGSHLSLSSIYANLNYSLFIKETPSLVLVVIVIFIILLVENARVPFDDPETHLELTMVHEVMILDHGGPDLALLSYAGALKFWVFASLLAEILLPLTNLPLLGFFVLHLVGMMGIAVAVGMVESSIARFKFSQLPQLLIGAGTLSALALALTMRL